MTTEYKIIRDPFLKGSFDRPIEKSITDLLTDRTMGCSFDIIEAPVEDHSSLIRIMSEMVLPQQLAFNQGPNYSHIVILNSPNRIRTGNGPTYVLDNAFDEKEFYILPENIPGARGQREKVENHYTLLGDADKVIEEFKKAGYTFLDKLFEYRQERFKRINEMPGH